MPLLEKQSGCQREPQPNAADSARATGPTLVEESRGAAAGVMLEGLSY